MIFVSFLLTLRDAQCLCADIFQVCSTMVAEHLVSDLLEQSNLQELNGSEKQFEVETERLNSRLEHARANNAVLALTLHESKAQCDRYIFKMTATHVCIFIAW